MWSTKRLWWVVTRRASRRESSVLMPASWPPRRMLLLSLPSTEKGVGLPREEVGVCVSLYSSYVLFFFLLADLLFIYSNIPSCAWFFVKLCDYLHFVTIDSLIFSIKWDLNYWFLTLITLVDSVPWLLFTAEFSDWIVL